jgi:hypothetical protein
VVNVILWDGVTPYAPPGGTTLVSAGTLAIGDVVTA